VAEQQHSFPLPHVLQPGEVVESQAAIEDVVLAVTSHRFIVVEDGRTLMDVPFAGLRRIQLDIERGRTTTLVVVPEHIGDEPRVVSVPIAQLRDTVSALALLGERINGSGAGEAHA
jgi:hypothetical protein